MNALFDDQTLEYFCNQQTKSETEKVLQWCSNEIDKKINDKTTKKTKNFMMFVRRKVVDNLTAIFTKKDDKNQEDDYFVSNYRRLYNLYTLEPEKSEADLTEREKIASLLRARAEKRVSFLQKQMTEPKIAHFIQWFENNSAQICAVDFNMIVSLFTEELTQTILGQAVRIILFPTITKNLLG